MKEDEGGFELVWVTWVDWTSQAVDKTRFFHRIYEIGWS